MEMDMSGWSSEAGNPNIHDFKETLAEEKTRERGGIIGVSGERHLTPNAAISEQTHCIYFSFTILISKVVLLILTLNSVFDWPPLAVDLTTTIVKQTSSTLKIPSKHMQTWMWSDTKIDRCFQKATWRGSFGWCCKQYQGGLGRNEQAGELQIPSQT